MEIRRPAGEGWLVLIGGGEFSFGETRAADAAWLGKTGPGTIGFLPAASGSVDYGRHFAAYVEAEFGRAAETIPVYRDRDARRRRNAERIAAAPAVYLGGGVTDHLLDALGAGGGASPVAAALAGRFREGGVVVAIAAAAQAAGAVARSIAPREYLPGLGWLPGGAVEPNFDPGHDRRLRQLLARPGVAWGLGIPAGAAVLLGPGGAVEVVGTVFGLEGAEGELLTLAGAAANTG
jgi:cyanophycinase-like exopeptidase